MADGWTTIESEPAVFHQLIQEIGCDGVQASSRKIPDDLALLPHVHLILPEQVEEIWSLDESSLHDLEPVHGLIFLFKWTSEVDPRPCLKESEGKLFFAKQVISNACATQAILSVLLNAEGLKDSLGSQLTEFRDFTADFPPDMKGLAIGNSDTIRLAHNSFARPEPLVPDDKEASSKDDDAFHFVSYVPVDGTLYELDGLKEGPIPLATCASSDWLDKVVPHIQERMARYAEKEVRFNVMAIVGDRLAEAERRTARLVRVRQAVLDRLSGKADIEPEVAVEVPSGHEELQAKMHSVEAELASLQGEVQVSFRGPSSLQGEVQVDDPVMGASEWSPPLTRGGQEEQDKRQRWADENVRRRFNYVPLLFNALRLLAERGELAPLVERARTLKPMNQPSGS